VIFRRVDRLHINQSPIWWAEYERWPGETVWRRKNSNEGFLRAFPLFKDAMTDHEITLAQIAYSKGENDDTNS
jgi:hypothetical protein